MKNWKTILATIFALLVPALVMAAAQVSTVNPTVPAQNSPLLSSVIRGNALATYNDINQIFSNTYVTGNQVLGNASAGQAVGLTIPSCSTGTSALTWTTSSGFGCNNAIGGGITALTGDGAASGTGSVAFSLSNTSTARTNIGLGLASTPGFAGLSLSAAENINLNSNALLATLTGTVVHAANANSIIARYQLDAFGNSAHFSAVRYDGTAASPTTIQSADVLGSYNAWGYDGTAVGAGGSYQVAATQAWTPSAHGANASIWTTPNGTITPIQQVIVGNDGGVTLGSPSGGDKGANTLNSQGTIWSNGVQLQNGALVAGTNITITGSWPNQTINATTSGGGSVSLSALTAATTTNTIDNGASAQEWDWNALTTGTALKHVSTSITTGRMLDVEATNIANTGYAGYFSNTSSSGWAVFSQGALAITTSFPVSTTVPLTVTTNWATGSTPIAYFLAPNITTGQQVFWTWGHDTGGGNSGGLSFTYRGSNNANSAVGLSMNNTGRGLYVFPSGSVRINSSATAPTTAAADFLDIDGGLGLTATTATIPAAGMYAPIANELDLTSTGAAQIKLLSSGLVVLPNITSDATHTDASVCEDTTTHALYFGSGTIGICLGTSSARFKRDIIPMPVGLKEIKSLKPVNYFYKSGYGDNGAKQQYGFLAEDMVGVIPGLVGIDKGGRPNSVDLVGLVPILVNAVQQQQSEIDVLKTKLATKK